MKIKLLTSMSGDDGSYTPGDVVDLEPGHAERMIASGQAEPVAAKKKSPRTTRTVKPEETR